MSLRCDKTRELIHGIIQYHLNYIGRRRLAEELWAGYQKIMEATLSNDLNLVKPGVKTAKSTNEHNDYQTEYCALWNESMGHKKTVNMFDCCS